MYNTCYKLFLILCLCTYNNICDTMQGTEICLKKDEFHVLRILHTTLQSKNICNCHTHNGTFEWQKTQRWSPHWFLRYTLGMCEPHQRGGWKYQHQYWSICSKFLYILYLHRYHPTPTIIGHLGKYFEPSGKWVWGSMTWDLIRNVPTITITSWNFRCQSDQNSDTE